MESKSTLLLLFYAGAIRRVMAVSPLINLEFDLADHVTSR